MQCKTEYSDNMQPIHISKSIIINRDYSWVVYVHQLVVSSSSSLFIDVPEAEVLSTSTLPQLVDVLVNNSICPGNNDEVMIDLCEKRKGKFVTIKKDLVAFLHVFGRTKTVRHVSCSLLVKEEERRCSVCMKYRDQLRAMVSQSKLQSIASSRKNDRYLNTPQRKLRISSLRQKMKKIKTQNARLRKRIENVISHEGISTDLPLEDDLKHMIDTHQTEINDLAQNDFRRIFWNQQVN